LRLADIFTIHRRLQSSEINIRSIVMNPAKFMREVKQETNRVVWPTRKETTVSTAMVLILATLSALFFLLVDNVISLLVQAILGIGG
jgi:preprotein translocase subunit SecE